MVHHSNTDIHTPIEYVIRTQGVTITSIVIQTHATFHTSEITPERTIRYYNSKIE